MHTLGRQRDRCELAVATSGRPGNDSMTAACSRASRQPSWLMSTAWTRSNSPRPPVRRSRGMGQRSALGEAYHDPTLAADLQAFDRAYHLPDPQLTVVNLGSGQSNVGWALEESLDVEWAHAIAPGANLVVVEAKSESRPSLL